MITRLRESLAKRRTAAGEGDAGFTLIELLVVVLIIGVLAGISIPIYVGVQNSAKDSAAQSDLTNDKTAVVTYYSQKNAFPALPTSSTPAIADLVSAGWVGSVVGNTTTTATTDIGNFCLKATSGSGTVFYITQASGPAVTSPKPANCV
ncbi:type IV pilin protein [uncultured Amnibacterium sp.]|uniref:type IV pilin protein n=1 Tax=uncultured Amnibacterium sp. TaxID=1631851 RepID=UPI0035C98B79